ncbi:TPA: hypothetical protein N0F65_006724 [Lagenidium giganteum]|uniref:Uncharacterized protein n=1 Tax=Lagenidium giganteum TaxID=4803 RepID=A0AAV2Z3R2_9STRA|nr:TPA: hypothetical protein N0F65_006724 [Lagenidium giganteum]
MPPILCPSCQSLDQATVAVSASPIIAAFHNASGRCSQEHTAPIPDVVSLCKDDNDVEEPKHYPKTQSGRNPRAQPVVSTLHDRRDAFQAMFISPSRQANLKKAKRWWDTGAERLQLPRGSLLVSKVMTHGRKTVRVKARSGGGRKPQLLSEFSRLRKLGSAVRFAAITTSNSSAQGVQSRFYGEEPRRFRCFADRTDHPMMDSVLYGEAQNCSSRADRDKQVSTEKTQAIREKVTKHLGVLRRGFENGDVDEDTIENVDETHFIIDFDTGKTLRFVGETSIKYAAVVLEEGKTIVVRITGVSSAHENYPIRGVPDDVGGVRYRTE